MILVINELTESQSEQTTGQAAMGNVCFRIKSSTIQVELS